MVYSSELGHHLDRCYHDQDGNFIVPEDASIVIQSSGFVRDENYESITCTGAGTGTTALNRQGFSKLICSTAGAQFSLAAPAYPGVSKEIMTFSTAVITVVSGVRMNNSLACRVMKFTNPTTHTTTEPEMLGSGVKLYGATTALWLTLRQGLSTTADFALSSAT